MPRAITKAPIGRERFSRSPSLRAVVGHAARHAVVAEEEHREEGQFVPTNSSAKWIQPMPVRRNVPVTLGHQ